MVRVQSNTVTPQVTYLNIKILCCKDRVKSARKTRKAKIIKNKIDLIYFARINQTLSISTFLGLGNPISFTYTVSETATKRRKVYLYKSLPLC